MSVLSVFIGVTWPPVKGWPMRVIGKDFPAETIEKLLAKNTVAQTIKKIF